MNAPAVNDISVVIIAAVARNGVIGGGNTLPWRLSSDLKHFKALTMGKPMIMGRKTFDSIGKPLPGRETIIVTKGGKLPVKGVFTAQSMERALEVGLERAEAMATDEVCVVGGGEIYRMAMDFADRLYITHVDLAPRGDVFFPAINEAQWQQTSLQECVRSDKDEAGFSFAIYDRK